MQLHLVLAITVVVVIAFYVSALNPINVDFYLTKSLSYKVPLVVIVMASIFIGSLLVALMEAVKGIRGGILKMGTSARERKASKLHQPYRKGMQFLEAGYMEEAQKEFSAVLERDPKHVPTLMQLGKLKASKGEHQEALKLHNRALLLEPENLEATFLLAEDYAGLGRYQKAQSVLEGAPKKNRHELSTLTKLREICLAGMLWEDALPVQNEIVRLTKDKGQAERELTVLSGIHYELGNKALKAKSSNDAIKEFKAILKIKPDFAPAYAGLGDAYLIMGKEEDALKAWDEGYRATASPSLLKRQEELFMKKEDPASAIAIYKASMQAADSSPALSYLVGLVYLKLEMIEEALREFRRVQASGAIIPGMASLMASIYERSGEKDLAAMEYRRELKQSLQSLPIFKCNSCGEASQDWKGRCPRCGNWDTYRLNMEKGEPIDENIAPPPAPGL